MLRQWLMLASLALLTAAVAGVGSIATTPACRFGNRGQTPVVYFGGNESTDAQVNAWADAAASFHKYGSHFTFEAYSLHGAPHDQASVLGSFGSAADIRHCVERINSASFKGPVVLVGHSDGSWVINAIAAQVAKKNRGKIKLVNLDGFPLNAAAAAGIDLQCWTSYNRDKQGTPPATCGNIAPSARSRSTDQMAQCKPGSCHILAASGCHSDWCLHYRLINANASATLGDANRARIGYDRVEPPLVYLDKFLGSAQKPAGVLKTEKTTR